MKLIDLAGQTFGRLKVIALAHDRRGGQAMWSCVCSCGEGKVVFGSSLRRGESRSCGCLARELSSLRATRHGYARDGIANRSYATWTAMRARCRSAKHPAWHNYGGRGIVVCPRWLTFENFLADMGDKPEGLELDRVDNDGNYEPGNCRWVNHVEQNQNRRDSYRVAYDGRTQCLTALSQESGFSRTTLRGRLRRGWSIERAMTTPSDLYHKSRRLHKERASTPAPSLATI
jgi:hypothetical protein